MTDATILYLRCYENFPGRYTNEQTATNLIRQFKWQLLPEKKMLESQFPENSKVGKLIRLHLTELSE